MITFSLLNKGRLRVLPAILSFLLLLTSSVLFSQEYPYTARNLPEKFRNEFHEIYFCFPGNRNTEIIEAGRYISIDRIEGSRVFAYASRQGFEKFLSKNIPFDILPAPSSLHHPVMVSDVNISQPTDWDFYPTYEAYVSMMEQFAALYPGICQLVEAGTSHEGRKILFAKISDNITLEEHEPRFMYTSSIHGDETTGYILMLRLINYLLSGYEGNAEAKYLVDNLEIWINPLANPDGTYRSGNNTVFNATRFNANNVDLNRNYADPQDGPHPDGNAWQKETLVFMDLADSLHFVMSANLHGGTEVCNYPWDTWAKLHADDEWYHYISREYADTVHIHSYPGYFDDLDNGVTNGYAWYTISGGRQDYMNYFHHCREITIELSVTKLLPESQLPAFWDYNYRSLLGFMEQAIYGFRGKIIDSETGEPVRADVVITGHDMDNSYVQANPDGWFFRPVYPGSYDLSFSAPAYETTTVTGLQAGYSQIIPIDIQLVYNGSATTENSENTLRVYPNPVSGKSIMVSGFNENEPVETYHIIDMNGKVVLYGINPDHRDKRILIHIEDLNPGAYRLVIQGKSKRYSSAFLITGHKTN